VGAWPQTAALTWRAEMPSSSAARCQALTVGVALAAGAVSARNCSRAATIAAASVSEAVPETISMRGLGGRRLPLLAMAGNLTCLA
jgi:acid phosphatase family membrane protein YuiD